VSSTETTALSIERERIVATVIKYQGKVYATKKRLAEALGINYDALNMRMSRGLPLQRAIDFRPKSVVTYRGSQYNSYQHLIDALKLDLTVNQLQYRLKKTGGSLDKAVNYQVPQTKVIFKGVTYPSLKKLCDKLGLVYSTVKNRINRQAKSIEEAISMSEKGTSRSQKPKTSKTKATVTKAKATVTKAKATVTKAKATVKAKKPAAKKAVAKKAVAKKAVAKKPAVKKVKAKVAVKKKPAAKKATVKKVVAKKAASRGRPAKVKAVAKKAPAKRKVGRPRKVGS